MTLREKAFKLNAQVDSQFRANGVTNHKGKIVKPFSTFPESEWKSWMVELIKIRDEAYKLI